MSCEQLQPQQPGRFNITQCVTLSAASGIPVSPICTQGVASMARSLHFRRWLSKGAFPPAGYRIRKGTFLATSIWTMHRDESLWHDAESFIPERWLDDTPEAVGRNDHAFAPFGDGPRKCVAFRFALEEAKITLIHLYQQFVFKLEPGQVPLQLRHTITLSPKDGVRVTIHPRKSPHANGGPQ